MSTIPIIYFDEYEAYPGTRPRQSQQRSSQLTQQQQQVGGYVEGQKSSTDPEGYRVFVVYTLVGDTAEPLYKDDNAEVKEMKTFRGKSPKEVAKKVVTEICQMIKKSDPAGYKKWCRAATSADINKREKELMDLENLVIKDVDKASAKINWNYYPGFQFIMEDTLNQISEPGATGSRARTYKYYGERVKLDEGKKYKGKKFNYESQVIPIRKDYTLVQALIDHIYKSDKAAKRYSKTQNFAKHRNRKRSSSRKRSPAHQNLMKMNLPELKRKCNTKGSNSWKVTELDQILRDLGLTRIGNKGDKCRRIIEYYQQNI